MYEGLRSFGDQEYFYSLGRDKDGNIVSQKDVVTNVKPGMSRHNYGIAADMVRKIGDRWCWDYQSPAWKELAEYGKSIDLTCGYFWQSPFDPPHFQLKTALTVEVMKKLYEYGGLTLVRKNLWYNTDPNKVILI